MREPGDCNPKRRGSQYNCVFLHCIFMDSGWRESVGKFGAQYEMVRSVLRTLQDCQRGFFDFAGEGLF